MKTLKVFVFLLASAATITFSYAQDHHKAPHGGKVVDANDGYHIEMVKVKDSLNFYVIHPKDKPDEKITSSKVEYEFSNKTKAAAPTTASPAGKVSVALPKANVVEFATITLTIDGKEVTAKIKNDVSEDAKKHGHEH
jgi:hypothetical protein